MVNSGRSIGRCDKIRWSITDLQAVGPMSRRSFAGRRHLRGGLGRIYGGPPTSLNYRTNYGRRQLRAKHTISV